MNKSRVSREVTGKLRMTEETTADSEPTPTDSGLTEIVNENSPDEPTKHDKARWFTAARKLIGGTYSSTAVVGIILFFLPWMSMSCADVRMLHQSGYDIMTGNHTENENFGAEFNAKMAETLRSLGKDASNFEKQTASKRRQGKKRESKKSGTVYWLIFYPVGLLLVAAFGPIVVLANRPVRPFVTMTPEREKIARDREDAATASHFDKARRAVTDEGIFSPEQITMLRLAFDQLEKALASQQRRHDVRYKA